MKTSRVLVLVLAVGAAGGAFMLATGPKPAPVEAPVAAAPPPIPTDEVLVAGREIPLGTVVGDPDLSWQPWPKTGVASGMITRAADPKALDDLRGSIARAAFYQGEPIRQDRLIKGNGGFLSAVLPAGMRAVAINIDSQGSTSAGNFIQPGDRVDVVRTYPDTSGHTGAGASAMNSETLLHNVRVLAIGQNLQDKNGQPTTAGSTATLELDPVQAEQVILAQRIGQLSLTLRSMQDVNQAAQDTAPKAQDKDVTVVRYGFASDGLTR